MAVAGGCGCVGGVAMLQIRSFVAAAATSKYGHLDTGHQLGIHDQDILSPAAATGGTVRHRLVSRIRGYTTFGKPEIGDSAAFLLNPGR